MPVPDRFASLLFMNLLFVSNFVSRQMLLTNVLLTMLVTLNKFNILKMELLT